MQANAVVVKNRATSVELLEDTQGLTTVEYIIILCLIAVVGFAVWKKFGETVKEKTNDATNVMDTLPGESSE